MWPSWQSTFYTQVFPLRCLQMYLYIINDGSRQCQTSLLMPAGILGNQHQHLFDRNSAHQTLPRACCEKSGGEEERGGVNSKPEPHLESGPESFSSHCPHGPTCPEWLECKNPAVKPQGCFLFLEWRGSISKFKRRPSYVGWLLSITKVSDHFSFDSMSDTCK